MTLPTTTSTGMGINGIRPRMVGTQRTGLSIQLLLSSAGGGIVWISSELTRRAIWLIKRGMVADGIPLVTRGRTWVGRSKHFDRGLDLIGRVKELTTSLNYIVCRVQYNNSSVVVVTY